MAWGTAADKVAENILSFGYGKSTNVPGSYDTGPTPIDDENVEQFIDRWSERLARAYY